jgi:hypothetical protein
LLYIVKLGRYNSLNTVLDLYHEGAEIKYDDYSYLYYVKVDNQEKLLELLFNVIIDIITFSDIIRKLSKKNFSHQDLLDDVLKIVTDRKEHVIEILTNVDLGDVINVEGIVNFRLKKLLNEVVSEAESNLFKKRDDEEFVKLMKWFVGMNEPVSPIITLTVNKDDTVNIFDKDNNSLNHLYEGLIPTEEVDIQSLVLSILATLSPEKIVLLDETDNKEMQTMIKNIFGDRIVNFSDWPHKTPLSDKIKLDE